MRRVGAGSGARRVGRPCGSTPLRCSDPGRAANSLRALQALRSDMRSESDVGSALRAPPRFLRSSPPQSAVSPTRAHHTPLATVSDLRCARKAFATERTEIHRAPSARSPLNKCGVDRTIYAHERRDTCLLAQTPVHHAVSALFAWRRSLTVASGVWCALAVLGALWGGEERRIRGGARSALPTSDSLRMFERSDRRERSEFAARPGSEHRNEVAPQGRPTRRAPDPTGAHRTPRLTPVTR